MTKKDNIDRSATRAYYLEVKKKNTLEFIREFQKSHRVWMQDLADAYKERKRFGNHLFALADFYNSKEDKEVALLASLFLSENDSLLIQQQELYNILGASPYKNFLCNRRFTELARGDVQSKHLTNSMTSYYEICDLFQRIYEIIEEYGSVEDACYALLIKNKYFDPFLAMVKLLHTTGVHARQYKLNLLLMVLATNDGMGLGLWNFKDKNFAHPDLYCPENRNLTDFLEVWFPDYIRCGLTFDKAVNAMGMREQTDFYYAYRGFEELKMVNPAEVVAYCRRYQKRYNERNSTRPYILKELEPKIFFDPIEDKRSDALDLS